MGSQGLFYTAVVYGPGHACQACGCAWAATPRVFPFISPLSLPVFYVAFVYSFVFLLTVVSVWLHTGPRQPKPEPKQACCPGNPIQQQYKDSLLLALPSVCLRLSVKESPLSLSLVVLVATVQTCENWARPPQRERAREGERQAETGTRDSGSYALRCPTAAWARLTLCKRKSSPGTKESCIFCPSSTTSLVLEVFCCCCFPCRAGPYPQSTPAPILLPCAPSSPLGLLTARVRLPHCCCVFGKSWSLGGRGCG